MYHPDVTKMGAETSGVPTYPIRKGISGDLPDNLVSNLSKHDH
jgi:hypothetical protein